MMTKFSVENAIDILDRTPNMILTQLKGLDDQLIHATEGENTWSPFDVLGHLIVCEETNFMARVMFIIDDTSQKALTPIDMDVHLHRNSGKTIPQLGAEFKMLRENNLNKLRSLRLSAEELQRTALHPRLGVVTVENILATWVAHDLTHLSQMNRVIAKQFKAALGPFIYYLPKLNS